MRDLRTLKKPSPALQLSIQLTRAVLGIVVENVTEETLWLNYLLDNLERVLTLVRDIHTDAVDDCAYEEICRIMEDASYDASAAARESEDGFFLDLDTILTKLCRNLAADHDLNRRLSPTTRFCVGVDGSRQAYMAFEVTTRLRRQGSIAIVNVDEDKGTRSIQLPMISADFIVEEFKSHSNRLRVPTNRVHIETIKDPSSSLSVATQLLDASNQQQADFLVIGAIGKGGPAIDQLGHIPREVLRFAPIPVIVVPPAPVNAISSLYSTFVVAIDRAPSMAQRCLNTVLKLMRPVDHLRIVHFYKKPIVGIYDEDPFIPIHAFLKTARLNGVLDVLPCELGATIVESLQDYVANHNAAYLVAGLSGDGTATTRDVQDAELENAPGRVASGILHSPRCTLCICP